jgi:hypothetical protein
VTGPLRNACSIGGRGTGTHIVRTFRIVKRCLTEGRRSHWNCVTCRHCPVIRVLP